MSKIKLFRDPVHDIIALDLGDPVEAVLFELMCTSAFQRLRRIRQLGFAQLVYHGAEHSRFSHSLGALHVARRMVHALGMGQSEEERLEVLCAALLHDVGHGPFSHAIEQITEVHHELYTAQIVCDPEGEVARVLAGVHASLPERVARYFGPKEDFPRHKRVLRDIVSSQLDADRMDYILRDGIATGVKIGHYDFERIQTMLTVYPGDTASGQPIPRLAVSHRGREAVEVYLMARFHMFKQVYLHKTVRVAEKMLEAVMCRAAELVAEGCPDTAGPDPVLEALLSRQVLSTQAFLSIDDTDIWSLLKRWSRHEDPILRRLALGLVDRRLYKTVDLDHRDPVHVARLMDRANEIAVRLGLDPRYHVLLDRAQDTPYRPYDPSHPSAAAHIPIVERDGRVTPIEETSDLVHLLGRDAYRMLRLCVAEEIREPLERHLRPGA